MYPPYSILVRSPGYQLGAKLWAKFDTTHLFGRSTNQGGRDSLFGPNLAMN